MDVFYTFISVILLSKDTVSNDVNTKLLFSDGNKISILDVDSKNSTVIADGYSRVLFVAYHSTKHFIFWSDFWGGTISRIRYPSHGNKTIPEQIGTDSTPTGIAVDSDNDHLYLASFGRNKIYRTNLDGSNPLVILDNLMDPIDIELDTLNGPAPKVFQYINKGNVLMKSLPTTSRSDSTDRWMFFNDDNGLQKCKLDGSGKQVIVSDVSHSENIALDFNGERIYWTDVYQDKIKSAFFDGSDVQSIFNANSLMGIEVTGSTVYFGVILGNLYSLQKSNQSSVSQLIYTTNELWDIKLYTFDEECSTYLLIENENKRSSGYILDWEFDTVFSDDTIETAWYRVLGSNGDKMPNHPPGVQHCGTTNPIWVNGTLPENDDGNVTRTACVQTVDDICEQTIDIEIRKCVDYYLYYLHSTTANSSYCFGSGPVICSDGLSSETGFYPGCTSNFPSDIVPVTVRPELIEGAVLHIPGIAGTPSLIPVFRCSFDDVSNGTYFYDVHWFINGNNVITRTKVHFSDLTTTDLKHTDWIGTYKMNMEVKCAIRSRYSANSTPSPLMYSSVFHAGLYPDKYEYTVIEGESININFTSTVPVGCASSHTQLRSKCQQNFFVFQPEYKNKDASCSNNIAKRDIVFRAHFCGISLGSVDWWTPRTLQVNGYSDGLYNSKDRSTNIRISTSSISLFNNMWEDVQIPDIKVIVLDKDAVLTNRLCQSYNDPHITTFDGRVYHYMNVGEFVMYRNDKGPYWVHALLTNCGFGWQGSSCHCGVAIRSRNSLLVLRTCAKISRTHKSMLAQPVMQLISCDDSDLLIDQQGTNYKITLPIGTEIRFSISRWSGFISMISVKPAIFDINKAKGLCGYPSTTKDPSDDFIHRENGQINDYQEFGNSWRIDSSKSNEQLFVDEPEFLSNGYFGNIDDTSNLNSSVRYCNCEQEASSAQPFDEAYTVQCNLTESTSLCTDSLSPTGNTGFYTSCSTTTRQKRSADFHHSIVRRSTDDSDDVYESQPLQYDDSVDSQEEVVQNTFRNGWTQEKAYQECNKTLQESFAEIPNDFVDVENDGYVASCVIDIQLVGDTTFLQDTLSAIATKIMVEVVRNESFYNLTTEDGSRTLLEYFTELLCPNNCSENGNCTAGICSCYEGFIGNDCSQQKSQPPSDVSLPFSGLCTLGTRQCKSTNIYSNFLSNTVWYKLKYFKIQDNVKTYTSGEEIYTAVYRNVFMVTINLPIHRRKRSTWAGYMADGYEISFSYDRSNFGEHVILIIYDENCYTCNQTSVSCTSLNTCASSTETPSTSDSNGQMLVAIGASVGVVIVAIALIACLVYKKSKDAKKIDTLPPLNAMTKSDVWMDNKTTGESKKSDKITLSSFDFELDDRCETPFELFMQSPPISHNTNNSKPRFDSAHLKTNT